LQAAVLLAKLKHIDKWNRLRQEHALLYDDLLSRIPGVITPTVLEGAVHVYHLYVIRIEWGSRDRLQQFLHECGVQTGIHYPKPIPFARPFAHLRETAFPVAEELAQKILSLPLYPELTKSQVEYVVAQIDNYMKTCG